MAEEHRVQPTGGLNGDSRGAVPRSDPARFGDGRRHLLCIDGHDLSQVVHISREQVRG